MVKEAGTHDGGLVDTKEIAAITNDYENNYL